MRKLLLLFGLLWVFTLYEARGQDRVISGKITSKSDGMGIPGVTISVPGTTIGTVSDINGGYKLTLGEQVKKLIFSGVGLKKQELEIGASTSLDVLMEDDVLKLNEMVVTALGIPREKKSLGYSVQQVGGDALTKANQGNVVNGLSGKVAGVQVISSSGAAGASSNIQLRGANSITGSNQPLFVIDGVPIDNSTNYSGNPDDGSNNLLDGVGYSNRAIDINPDDIESISVLKGGAATALYGLGAGNGAIIITTKKGSKQAGGQKIAATFNSGMSWEKVNRFVETQQKYGQGSRFDDNDVYTSTPLYYGPSSSSFYRRFSWGPNIDNLAYDGASDFRWSDDGDIVLKTDPTAKGAAKKYDQNDFFQTGLTRTNSLSLYGGGDNATFRFSLSNTDQKGVIPLNTFKRTTVSMAGTSDVSDKVKISGNATYTKSGGDRIQQGSNTSGLMLGLLRTPITFDNRNGTTDPKDEKAYVGEDGRPRTYRGRGGYDNPYWTINRNPFTDDVNRVIGNIQVQANLMPWLLASYRLGGDVYSDVRDAAFDIYSATASAGRVKKDAYSFHSINSNLQLTASHKLTDDINGSLMIGHDVLDRKMDETYVQGDGLTIPQFYNLANAQSIGTQNLITKYRTYSAFFDAKVDFKSYLYLDITGRNDWTSTLSKDNNSFFYPAVSLAFVFTDAFGMSTNKILPFGKLRLSYSSIGKDAPVYATKSYYSKTAYADGWTSGISFPFDGTPGFRSDDIAGNSDLKPEKQNEFEIGTDLRFLENRIGLDFTYYNRKETNVIIPVAIAASTGYLQAYFNSGEIQNKGIEIGLNLTPVKTKNFNWDIFVNWSQNKSKVVKLADGLENIPLGGFEGSDIRAVKDQPYGVIYGYEYKKDGSGNLVLDDNGSSDPNAADYNPLYATPVADTKPGVIGNPNAKWLMGIGNTFTYKGLSLYVLIDIKKGGDIWNGTQGALSYFGTSKITEDRGKTKVFEGNLGHLDADGNIAHYDSQGNEVAGAGASNSTAAELGEYWYTTEGGGFGTTAKQFVQDGSYTKLREASMSYDFGYSLLKNKKYIKGLEFGVYARNIILATKYQGIDPETSLAGAGSNAQGMDYFNMPGVKTYGVNLKVKF